MPTLKSAKKRLIQNKVRQGRNKSKKSSFRTEIRKLLEAIEQGNIEISESQIRLVCKKLDQAAAKNVLHRNAAARTKSRLSKKIKSLKQG